MWSRLGPSHANIDNPCDAARPCASRFGIGAALMGGSPGDLTPMRQDAPLGETIARYAKTGRVTLLALRTQLQRGVTDAR